MKSGFFAPSLCLGIFDTPDHVVHCLIGVCDVQDYVGISALPDDKQLVRKCLSHFLHVGKVQINFLESGDQLPKAPGFRPGNRTAAWEHMGNRNMGADKTFLHVGKAVKNFSDIFFALIAQGHQNGGSVLNVQSVGYCVRKTASGKEDMVGENVEAVHQVRGKEDALAGMKIFCRGEFSRKQKGNAVLQRQFLTLFLPDEILDVFENSDAVVGDDDRGFQYVYLYDYQYFRGMGVLNGVVHHFGKGVAPCGENVFGAVMQKRFYIFAENSVLTEGAVILVMKGMLLCFQTVGRHFTLCPLENMLVAHFFGIAVNGRFGYLKIFHRLSGIILFPGVDLLQNVLPDLFCIFFFHGKDLLPDSVCISFIISYFPEKSTDIPNF